MMTDEQKKNLSALLIFLFIMVCMVGCLSYVAKQSRGEEEHKAEFRRMDRERRERYEQLHRETQRRTDSIKNTVRNRKPTGKFLGGSYYDDDRDPYDDPDFDDLIPGEEYDEEFVDRSQGDPELYDGDS